MSELEDPANSRRDISAYVLGGTTTLLAIIVILLLGLSNPTQSSQYVTTTLPITRTIMTTVHATTETAVANETSTLPVNATNSHFVTIVRTSVVTTASITTRTNSVTTTTTKTTTIRAGPPPCPPHGC